MAGGAPIVAAAEPSVERDWPAPSAAFWALFVIVFATFMTFVDASIFSMLGKTIKDHFGLTDAMLGFIAGPAAIICYVFVGFPLARLADIYARKYVLAGSAVVVGTIISLGGIAQNLGQFFASRVFLAAGGSAHAPASYSLLADAFPPKKLPLAFALLQFGFIGGNTVGPKVGGKLAELSATWQPSHLGSLTIAGWQWVLIGLGIPSILIGLLFLTLREPGRLAPAADAPRPPANASFGRQILTFMGLDALKAINAKPLVYYPLFFSLALSAVETFGLLYWRPQFVSRTFGWTMVEIGNVMFWITLVTSLIGLVVGATLVSWLARTRKDANVVAATICFGMVTFGTIGGLCMPTAESSFAFFSIAGVFGIAGAVPQNAAIQRIAPNSMRGQVTAMYLFMFTFFGAMGSWFVGLVQTYIVGDESQLWLGLLITAVLLLPPATYLMYRAIKPYRLEVERLDALESSRA